MTDALRPTRSWEYLDFLDSIVPEFDEYRTILYAIVNLKEQNLPKNAATTESKIKPYPANQIGFTRRAILGEIIKFSLHLNHRDETIRNHLISMIFQLIGKIEYSYSDYEHLLRARKLMINEGNNLNSGNIAADDELHIEGLNIN